MKLREIKKEILHHIPFTLSATFLAILIVFGVSWLYGPFSHDNLKSFFEIAHPLHVFVSAITSTAIFYKHRKSILSAIGVGALSAILIGSLSDIIFPYVGGVIFGLKTVFELELIEKPVIIIGVALFGCAIGIATRVSEIPHFLHIGISITASLLYLFAFGSVLTTFGIIASLIIVFFAVLIPCCISDIIFPMLFIKDLVHCCNHKH